MGEAKRRSSIGSEAKFANLVRLFEGLQIDVSAPGFLDDPNFIKAESRAPLFLENYAKYIKYMPLEDAYLVRVRKQLPEFSVLLASHLERQAILGNCKQVCLGVSRLLDRLGIWNYVVAGSVAAKRRAGADEDWKYLRYVDRRDTPDGITGHFWLVVPPYVCVDPTIKWQRWRDREFMNAIPDTLMIETATHFKAKPEDIIDPNAPPSLIAKFQGALLDLVRFQREGFSALRVVTEETEFEYVPQGICAPNEPIEMIGQSAGFRPVEFWNESICSAFEVPAIGP